MKYLFIGGSLSGRRIETKETTYRHKVKLKNAPENLPPIEEVYKRASFTYGPVIFEVYLHISIKPEDIISLLKLTRES